MCSKEYIYKAKEKEKAKNQNAFKWLKAYFLEDVRVIECNSCDSHFQTNMIFDKVENLLEYYLHITYFMSCTFHGVCYLIWPSLTT